MNTKNYFQSIHVFLIGGIAFLFLFFIFSWSVKRGVYRNIDFAFTVKVQEAIDTSPRLRLSRAVGEVMEGSTFFASPEVSVVGIFILTGVAFFDWKKKKIRWTALLIPFFFFLLVMGEIYGKTVVHHPAPPFFMIKNPTSVFPKYYINEQFSYPSGHAARAVFIACVCSYFILRTSCFKKRNVKMGSILLLCTYVSFVSISRIYLGHHWLSDIVGGLLLGGGFGLLLIGTL